MSHRLNTVFSELDYFLLLTSYAGRAARRCARAPPRLSARRRRAAGSRGGLAHGYTNYGFTYYGYTYYGSSRGLAHGYTYYGFTYYGFTYYGYTYYGSRGGPPNSPPHHPALPIVAAASVPSRSQGFPYSIAASRAERYYY